MVHTTDVIIPCRNTMRFKTFIQKKVEPYWCERVGQSRSIGDFNVKTESLDISADYDIRVVTVNKGVNITETIYGYVYECVCACVCVYAFMCLYICVHACVHADLAWLISIISV